jgi:hypothetical protein
MNLIKKLVFPVLVIINLVSNAQDWEDGNRTKTKKSDSTENSRGKFDFKETKIAAGAGLCFWLDDNNQNKSAVYGSIELNPRFVLWSGKVQSSLAISTPLNIGIKNNSNYTSSFAFSLPVLLEGSIGHESSSQGTAFAGLFAGAGFSLNHISGNPDFKMKLAPAVSAGLRMGNIDWRSYTFRITYAPLLSEVGRSVWLFTASYNIL